MRTMSDHEPMEQPEGMDADQQADHPVPRGRQKGGLKADRILALERRRRAVDLRKAGATYQQIADQLGYQSVQGAWAAVKKAIDELPKDSMEEVRAMQMERINFMMLTLWPKVQTGDERAIDTSLRLMNQMDKYMGITEVQRVDVNVHQDAVVVVEGNQDDYIAALKRMAGYIPEEERQQIIAADEAPALMAGDIVDAELVDEPGEAEEMGPIIAYDDAPYDTDYMGPKVSNDWLVLPDDEDDE